MVSRCFPLMTVKTVTDTEDMADPHAAAQFLKHFHAHRHSNTNTHTEKETGHWFFRHYKILGFLMKCVFCFTTRKF